MRSALGAVSVLALLCGIVIIAFFVFTHASRLGFRIIACLLLVDQAILTLLYLRLPIDVAPLRHALRIGAIAILVSGALLLVWCALPKPGPMEFAMALVGIGMIVHGALTLRHLGATPRAETR